MLEQVTTAAAVEERSRPNGMSGHNPRTARSRPRRVLHEAESGFEVDDDGFAVLSSIRSGTPVDLSTDQIQAIWGHLTVAGLIQGTIVHSIIDQILAVLDRSLLRIDLAIGTDAATGPAALVVGEQSSVLLTGHGEPEAAYRLYSHHDTLPALIDYLGLQNRPFHDSPAVQVSTMALAEAASTADRPARTRKVLCEAGVTVESAELVAELLQKCAFSVQASARWQVSRYSYANQSFSFLDGGALGYWTVTTRGVGHGMVQLQPSTATSITAGIRSMFAKARLA